MAIGKLCGGHGFALADIDCVDYLAILIDDLIRTGLGTSVSAIKSHAFTSDTLIMGGIRQSMRRF